MNLIEQISKLNEIKREIGLESFKSSTFKKVLKNSGFTSVETLIIGLKKYDIIVPVDNKGNYRFKDKNPIYIMKLEKAIEHSKSLVKKYVNKYQSKTSNKSETKSEEVVLIDPIKEAIILLKNKGYKIYKPTVTFEEI